MSQTDSPLKRSIGLSGVIRFLIAVAAVFAVGAAFADGHYALAIAGVVFLVVRRAGLPLRALYSPSLCLAHIGLQFA